MAQALYFLILVSFCSAAPNKLTISSITEITKDQVYGLTVKDIENGLDHIWNIQADINAIESNEAHFLDITVKTLEINPEEGDFIIFCEYSLPESNLFVNGSSVDKILDELPLDNSLLVTSRLRYNTTDNGQCFVDPTEVEPDCEIDKLIVRYRYDVASGTRTHQGFIYFHSEPRTDSSGPIGPKANEMAFEFTLAEIAPPPLPTTTERLPTDNRDDFYVSCYIKGLTPHEVYTSDTDILKEAVAELVSDMCLSIGIEECQDLSDLSYIRFDPDTDIRICDPHFPFYHTCAMVSFAVFVNNGTTKYIMNSTLLSEVWTPSTEHQINTLLENMTSATTGLSATAYFPEQVYEPIHTWVWVAAVLTVVVIFSSLMCYSLISDKVFVPDNPKRKDIAAQNEEHDHREAVRRLNANHPIVRVFESLRGKFRRRPSLDTSISSEIDQASVLSSADADSNRSRTTKGFTYKNPAFEDDQGFDHELSGSASDSVTSRSRFRGQRSSQSRVNRPGTSPQQEMPEIPETDYADEDIEEYVRY